MKVKVLQSFVHKDLGSFTINSIVDIDDKIAKEFVKQKLIEKVKVQKVD